VSESAGRRSTLPGFGLTMGLTLTWLSIIILLPLAGLFLKTFELSFDQLWAIVTSRRTLHALKVSFGLAFAAASVNLVMGTVIVWALVAKYAMHQVVQGWTAIMIVIAVFSGVQLLMIGILGEYIGRIYEEVKRRPLYVVGDTVNVPRKGDGEDRV